MANELVKYDNDLNDVSFIGFSAINYDVFMAVISRLRDKGEQKLVFPFADLRRLCNIEKKMSNQDFCNMLEDMSKKLGKLQILFKDEDGFDLFIMFSRFKARISTQTLEVSVNREFTYLLNNFTSFTQFELSQFTKLKSKYSRTLFRKLKQFRNTGSYHVTLEEFRRLFDVPKAKTNKDIMKFIIKPSIEELSIYFPDLEVEVHKLPKRGAPVGSYTFRFTGKGQIKGQTTIADFILPEKQKQGYKKKKSAEKKAKESYNKTHNFNERNYDYSKLEEIMLKDGASNPEPEEQDKTPDYLVKADDGTEFLIEVEKKPKNREETIKRLQEYQKAMNKLMAELGESQ